MEVYLSNEALGIFHNAIIPQFVARRKELGISQLEMDEIVGVAKGLVSKWECGIRKPSGYLFCIWADALNMTINLQPKVKHDNQPRS
jgi:transcriptional regulator with XRE-family HTH domain|tara:strand:- start:336 stop:596 length:261 start_codon:yes stop_codon:yes gene_type:complete